LHPLSPCFILHNCPPISTTHLVWDKKHLWHCKTKSMVGRWAHIGRVLLVGKI
jgi:hypothetical protein